MVVHDLNDPDGGDMPLIQATIWALRQRIVGGDEYKPVRMHEVDGLLTGPLSLQRMSPFRLDRRDCGQVGSTPRLGGVYLGGSLPLAVAGSLRQRRFANGSRRGPPSS